MNKAMKRFIGWLITIVVLLVLFLAAGPLYIVNEGTQVVVTRFSKITMTSVRLSMRGSL